VIFRLYHTFAKLLDKKRIKSKKNSKICAILYRKEKSKTVLYSSHSSARSLTDENEIILFRRKSLVIDGNGLRIPLQAVPNRILMRTINIDHAQM